MSDDAPLIVQRKKQHIQLALDKKSQMNLKTWDLYRLAYKALPEINLDEVNTETKLFNKLLSQPLIIASMTGGSQHSKTINSNLAKAAEETQVALGLGSMRVALEVEEARESFITARKVAPTTVIFANVGAVQLNYSVTVDDCRKLVDWIEADGLYLHVNPLQEAVQPEGDGNFKDLLPKIEMLVAKLGVPVWVKEVGHGLDEGTIQRLVDIGVSGIDIAGTGGTSWSGIEAMRGNVPNYYEWFKEIGWPTDEILKKIQDIEVLKVASGGIRSPIDGLKAGLLGADYYSAAYPFLSPALESVEKVIEVIRTWERGLQIGMFVIGRQNWHELEVSDMIEA